MFVVFCFLGITYSALAADQYSRNGVIPQPLSDQSSVINVFNPNAVPQPSADQSSFNNAFSPDVVPQPLASQSSFNNVINPNAVKQQLGDRTSFNNIFYPNAVPQPSLDQSSSIGGYPDAVQQPLVDQFSFNPDFISGTVSKTSTFPLKSSSDLPEIQSNMPRNLRKPSHLTSKHNSPQEHRSRSHKSRKSKKPSNQASKTNNSVKGRKIFSKVVRTFATNFIQKLLESQRFIDAFSLHKLSRQRTAQFFYDVVYQDNIKAGNRDPAFSAFTVSQAVKYNYRTAEKQHLMEVYAYTTGELLYQKGYLTAENAKTVSDKYFKATTELIEAANAHSPQENITAVRHGFINFLTSTNLFEGLTSVFDSAFVQVLYALRE